jgi:NAD+ diphosphatase
MTLLVAATRPNPLTGSLLDRAGLRREDSAWIRERLDAPDSLFVPMWRSQCLVRDAGGAPEAVYITGATAAARMAGSDRMPWAFLGLQREVAVFCLDLSTVDDPLALLPPDVGRFVGLREIPAESLPPHDASVLAHARGLMHWRSRTLFCSVCGHPCAPRSAGHVMRCTNCGTSHFPRTDPAVIMLVTSGDRCLLGRNRRATRPFYSTLAGFVEPGESLEEAVAREVFEEAGVQVANVRYHSSQPWPFPASIMLGFFAEATTETITFDTDELEDARWFTRTQVRDHEAHGFQLPGRISIARALIEEWLSQDSATT